MWFPNQLKLLVFISLVFLVPSYASEQPNPNILTFLRDELGMTISASNGQNFSAQKGDVLVEVGYCEGGAYFLTMHHNSREVFNAWGKDHRGGHDFHSFEIFELESFLDFTTCYLGFFSYTETMEWHRDMLRFIHETQGLEYFQVSSDRKQPLAMKIASQRERGTTRIVELNVMRNTEELQDEIRIVQINNLAPYEPSMGLPNNRSHATSIFFNLSALEEYTLGIKLMQPHSTPLPLAPMFYKFIIWTMDYFHLNTLKFSDVWPGVLLDPHRFMQDVFALKAGESYGEKSRKKELFLGIRWRDVETGIDPRKITAQEGRERMEDALTQAFENEGLGRMRSAEVRASEERAENLRGIGVEWLRARIHKRGSRGRTTK